MTLQNWLHRRLRFVALRRNHALKPVPFHDRRLRGRRPFVEALEARLPLGDAVLGGVVGCWLGSSLALPEPELRASDDTFAFDLPPSKQSAQSSSLERVSTFSRLPLAQPTERVIAPAGRSEPLEPEMLASWDTLPEWGPQEPVMGPAGYGHAALSFTSPSLWGRSTPEGSATVSLAVAAAASNFLPANAPGGNHVSRPGLLGSPVLPQSAGSAPAQASAQPRLQNFGRAALSFEANQGQTDSQVQYLAHGPGYTLFLTPTEAVFALSGTAASPRPFSPAPSRVEGPPLAASGSGAGSEGAVVHMQLLGSNASAKATGAHRLQGIVNYFIGNDPSNIPTYGKVQYQDVYPGIGLVYYGSEQQLEYDFQVAPGANPSQIRLGFAGAQSVSVDAAGDLVVQAGGQVLRQHPPVVYQDVAGQRREVVGDFVVQGQEVSFALGGYDRSRPLVIDPVLAYSTFLGGSGGDGGAGIAVDAVGNAYVSGTTTSPDFPTANALQPTYHGGGVDRFSDRDVFVAKLTADGSALVYSTYLGGSGEDDGAGIAVDATGNAYVSGTTASLDFPTVNALQPAYAGGAHDAFLAKLAADGSALVYSTYLGGSGDDNGYGIAVDGAGSAYLTGFTDSTNFPTANPLQPTLHSPLYGNAFVAKLTADGSALVYSSKIVLS